MINENMLKRVKYQILKKGGGGKNRTYMCLAEMNSNIAHRSRMQLRNRQLKINDYLRNKHKRLRKFLLLLEI